MTDEANPWTTCDRCSLDPCLWQYQGKQCLRCSVMDMMDAATGPLPTPETHAMHDRYEVERLSREYSARRGAAVNQLMPALRWAERMMRFVVRVKA